MACQNCIYGICKCPDQHLAAQRLIFEGHEAGQVRSGPRSSDGHLPPGAVRVGDPKDDLPEGEE